MSNREIFLFVAERFLGVPYHYGGYGPTGIDCSGIVNECEKALGRMGEKDDRTAETIWQHYRMQEKEVTSLALKPACLVFRPNAEGIMKHVEIIWRDTRLSIGASGGTPDTDTVAEALSLDARVKIRPWARLGKTLKFVDPFLGEPWAV